MFSRQPYPLHLNTNHKIHRRRRMNNRQFRLQPDRSLRYNNFCGTLEKSKQKNQSTTNLSQTTPILNLLFVPSLARVINSNRRQFVVAQFLPKFLVRTILKVFSVSTFSTKCLNVTCFTLTASGRLLFLGQTWHSTQYTFLRFIGVTQRTSSACLSQLAYNLHFNGI